MEMMPKKNVAKPAYTAIFWTLCELVLFSGSNPAGKKYKFSKCCDFEDLPEMCLALDGFSRRPAASLLCRLFSLKTRFLCVFISFPCVSVLLPVRPPPALRHLIFPPALFPSLWFSNIRKDPESVLVSFVAEEQRDLPMFPR